MTPKKIGLNKPRPVVKKELPLAHKSGRAFQETKKLEKVPKICFLDTDTNRPTRIGSIDVRKLN